MTYRFVHAADIHLDSPLRSLALRDPDLADLIGNATRRAFVRVVDLCLDEQVDALLLAGDLYDGDQTSMKTARFLAEQLRRLHEAGIRVFVIRGNHDALSRISKELTLPDSLKLFGGRAEAIAIERSNGQFPIAIHGLSFAQPHAPESLIGKYKPPIEGAVNIGLMHTSLSGAPGHDLYAPCSLADLQGTGFSYWALGHVHKRSIVEGGCAIVMPGMPQGRDVNEAGAKSVTLVTIGDDRSIRIEERVTSIAQFERVAVDATGIDDWRDLVAALARALEQARGDVASEHLVARLRVTGATPLAWRIRRDLDLLKTEADDRASVIGSCWVEKLEIDCRAPGVAAGASADPLTELRRLIEEEVIGSDAYQAEVAAIAEELRTQLPQECRGLLGSDEEAFKAMLAALAKDGSEDVLARLHAGAEGGVS
ncbi:MULTISPECIES: DNA repair exonuclease [unclassified Bosea (in: a-proteobacteria)]|uniref:metallophosphoesterase family protein n=1 Tax=unclassified Bosea (in: a-proteobacteria) TaxID=2653178 RepID=UPI000F74F77F|nr:MULTISPECIES: DNA repair exonuclease [unclassified Bosea (in: a-proteobacteria)]AZO82144.1 DNA repair exonuclease [Bosea sp. Tri-49]RXT20712.1 DNA repair exonuclease [Bosea sp. Tri-39]RXT33739.1 DNA repair exonuclease [Bosea sp. Tri-54]